MINSYMQVRVYDLKALIEATTQGKLTSFREDKVAILVGHKGCIVSCYDGTHRIFKDIEQEAKFYAAENKEPRDQDKAAAEVSIVISEIHKMGECEEIELGIFVKKSVTASANYLLLLDSIKKIGLNPKDFPRDPEEKN